MSGAQSVERAETGPMTADRWRHLAEPVQPSRRSGACSGHTLCPVGARWREHAMVPAQVRGGLGVFYPDGSPTQQIGIVPDCEVRPTIGGLRNGKDELLETAVRFVSRDRTTHFNCKRTAAVHRTEVGLRRSHLCLCDGIACCRNGKLRGNDTGLFLLDPGIDARCLGE